MTANYLLFSPISPTTEKEKGRGLLYQKNAEGYHIARLINFKDIKPDEFNTFTEEEATKLAQNIAYKKYTAEGLRAAQHANDMQAAALTLKDLKKSIEKACAGFDELAKSIKAATAGIDNLFKEVKK